LHPFSNPAIVKADGEKLRQAFLNIAINALQATRSGGRVKISLSKGESGYEISFNDNGTGIDAAALAKIFDPFFTTKPYGTGLGLAITRKIIETHGGTLTVESEVGKGTTVMVRLPVDV
jgi:signal transduction histidine kinase